MTSLSTEKDIVDLLKSENITNYDESIIAKLIEIVEEEKHETRESAIKYAESIQDVNTISLDIMRLACQTRQLFQPPLRQEAIDAARVRNARSVIWPLDGVMRVPVEQAISYSASNTKPNVIPLKRSTMSSSTKNTPLKSISLDLPKQKQTTPMITETE